MADRHVNPYEIPDPLPTPAPGSSLDDYVEGHIGLEPTLDPSRDPRLGRAVADAQLSPAADAQAERVGQIKASLGGILPRGARWFAICFLCICEALAGEIVLYRAGIDRPFSYGLAALQAIGVTLTLFVLGSLSRRSVAYYLTLAGLVVVLGGLAVLRVDETTLADETSSLHLAGVTVALVLGILGAAMLAERLLRQEFAASPVEEEHRQAAAQLAALRSRVEDAQATLDERFAAREAWRDANAKLRARARAAFPNHFKP